MKQTAVTPVVLGLLASKPRSGYDIKTIVDRSTRFFWAASYGQIYPELKRLEEAGLIEGEDVPNGGRERRVYKLTPAGREALEDWLLGTSYTVELRDESLLRLFFADALPHEQALMLLEGRKRGHEELLAALREIEALPGGKDPTFVDLVLHWGIDFNEWGAQWCEQQLAAPAQAEGGLTQPTFGGIFRAGMPGFLREGFIPLGAFYAGLRLGGLATGIAAATAASVLIYAYERRMGRDGLLVRISLAFVAVQSLVGLLAHSTTVYLAQPVVATAVWGLAFLVSAAIGRPLAGALANAWYPFPRWLRETPEYKRVFGIESVVWGLYFLGAQRAAARDALERQPRELPARDRGDRDARDAHSARVVDPLLAPWPGGH